jgi:hypothetical protein
MTKNVAVFGAAGSMGTRVTNALNAAPYGSGILAKGPDAYARYEPHSPEGDGRAREGDAGSLPGVRRAAGGSGPPVLAQGPAHRLDHRRHEPSCVRSP